MDIEQYKLPKAKANELWKEYVAAVKKNPKDKFLKDMKAAYNQLRQGRKVVNIQTIIERGGINKNFQPRLAIALINSNQVWCRYFSNGRVQYRNAEFGWSRHFRPVDIEVSAAFPELPTAYQDKGWKDQAEGHLTLSATVPKVPASLKPPKGQNNYYVLWEVEHWNKVEPPHDPYLLRRITPNMFVVVAIWNSTELERAVMKGRAWG